MSNFISFFQTSLRELYDLKLAYGPFPSFDDMGWYALAYLRIHELYGLDGFLRVTKDIYQWIWTNGWDTTVCKGGLWFDQNQASKNTIQNAQLFQLAMKLAKLSTRDTSMSKLLGELMNPIPSDALLPFYLWKAPFI